MSLLEMLIVAAVVLVAAVAVVSLFRKNLSGKGSCSCCSAGDKLTDCSSGNSCAPGEKPAQSK